jgi:poly-gamma-glutamate capsule biosynthesis protein CapA/YwtB (metallophosphatase superfamily)
MGAGANLRGMTPTIGLLGDVMLGRGVAERLAGGSPEEVWSREVRELCTSCDLVLCNLECCISTRGAPTERIPGKPFFFRGPPAAVESLRAIGVAAVGLANNHALDYEEEALLETLGLLSDAGIPVSGAGADESRARRGAVVEAGEARVGLVAVSDHPREFAAAEGSPGIAYADLDRGVPDWLCAELERLRAECDLVIAFPHWGPNMSRQPARWQREAAVEMRAAGASLVAGHSAHVFHGVGWEDGAPLLFDLGDALDDYAVNKDIRNDLGVIGLWRPEDPQAELELVGLSLDYCRTELAEGEDAEWIARRLADVCGALGSAVERMAEQRFRVSQE